MEAIFEIFLMIIPPRLIGFLIAVAFIAGGVYAWTSGGAERALYDAAVGSRAKIVRAEVWHKTVRSESTDGHGKYDSGSVDVNYLMLIYDEDGEQKSLDVQVDRDEYDSVKKDDSIRVSFHPDNPEYVVTPMKERPSVLWYRLGGGVLIALGVIFILMILVSFAD